MLIHFLLREWTVEISVLYPNDLTKLAPNLEKKKKKKKKKNQKNYALM